MSRGVYDLVGEILRTNGIDQLDFEYNKKDVNRLIDSRGPHKEGKE